MPFCRVEPERAGPGALGILVPPGQKTLVILRPRAHAWDLLPARWDGDPEVPPVFCTFERDEAAHVARRLLHLLEEHVERGFSPVHTVGDSQSRRFQVWLRTEELIWIACRRTPGKAYQPVLFETQEEARSAAELEEAVVWPGADALQEYYFNTQKFA
ncbi:MAG: hypothetical protein HY040_20475 [Planctomycetes bacterium]|nr:hypothetical protein [Planctomycetota bacterium]